ncbi:MAG: metal ABC transporter ATP-binding protein [Deltaproteobacteria bacterium]|nr:metal ABC transporter ATP-binding protein [Deltaproteobacteria bacterium]
MKNILTLEKLQIGYAGQALSSPLDLQFKAGTTLGIVGGNGAGKSTLLRTLLGQVRPIQGRFQWAEGTHFGYVPQKNEIDDLFPFSVLEVLQMGLYPQVLKWGKGTEPSLVRAREILQKIEMLPHEKKLFRELSGGQKQRVLLGRALMARPPVLLFDEPFNSLDHGFRQKFWKLLKEWQSEYHLSLILIEHDINLIINHVDQVILLGPHQSISGEKAKVLQQEILEGVLETPLHVHHEDAGIQIHFL